eukprot:Platyproteum_vivax@DN5360_c0_g1_i2.p1
MDIDMDMADDDEPMPLGMQTPVPDLPPGPPKPVPEDLMEDYEEDNVPLSVKKKQAVVRERVVKELKSLQSDILDDDRTTLTAAFMKENMNVTADITKSPARALPTRCIDGLVSTGKGFSDYLYMSSVNQIVLRGAPVQWEEETASDTVEDPHTPEVAGLHDMLDVMDDYSEPAEPADFNMDAMASPQTSVSSPDTVAQPVLAVDDDDLIHTLSTRAYKTLCWLRTHFKQENYRPLSFKKLAIGDRLGRFTSAGSFFEVLTLKTRGIIDVAPSEMGGDVTVMPVARFFYDESQVMMQP